MNESKQGKILKLKQSEINKNAVFLTPDDVIMLRFQKVNEWPNKKEM